MLNNSILTHMDKSIQPFLKQLQINKQIGVLRNEIKVVPVRSSREILKDQVTLSIPYANQTLKCDILFDLQFPELGPDFVFDHDSFLADPNANDIENYIPSLANWNPDDRNALINVINELLSYYKEHQLRLCEKYGSRVPNEHILLVNEGIDSKHIEVVLTLYGNKVEARFFIRLELDYSGLPYHNIHDFTDMAILIITYQGQDWKRIIPEIQFTEDLKEIILKYKSFSLPPMRENVYLVDYVPEVRNLIQERINLLATSHMKKRDFISILKVYQSDSILEYDSIDFTYISLLLEYNEIFFLVHIKFPDKFPQVKPEVTLHSIVHPKFIIINKFPYNCNADAKEMVSSIFTHILKHEFEKLQRGIARG